MGRPSSANGVSALQRTVASVFLRVASACVLILSVAGCLDGQSPDGGADGGASPDAGPRVVVEGAIAVDPDTVPPAHIIDEDAHPDGVSAFTIGALGTGPDGVTGTLAIDVGADTRSISVLAFGAPGDVLIATEVVDPDGALVLDDAAPVDLTETEQRVARGFPGQLFSPVRALPSSTSAALVLPAASAHPLREGVWRVRLGAFHVDESGSAPLVTPTLSPVVVSVLFDERPRSEERHVLQIVLHVGVAGIAAEDALTDPAIEAGVLGLTSTFDAIGVDVVLADVVAIDDESLFTVALDDDTCTGGDLDALFDSALVDDGALHVFVIERFTCVVAGGIPVGEGIAGIAAGIPGVAPVRRSTHAGVAVAHAFFGAQPDAFPLVVAHEVAHFLGLFHTREQARTGVRPIADLIDDTADTFPEARANLMSPVAGDDDTLTSGQAEIVRAHPLVVPP